MVPDFKKRVTHIGHVPFTCHYEIRSMKVPVPMVTKIAGVDKFNQSRLILMIISRSLYFKPVDDHIGILL